MSSTPKQDIAKRFGDRARAERYRDRFKHGRHQRTHERESLALHNLLALLGRLDVVVDVGGGTGRFVRWFSQYADRLVEIDFSPHMLQVSREDQPVRAGHGGYVQADARALPLADRSADLVFCHRLLNHLDAGARSLALREMARVSKRYVVISCLRPPAALRLARRLFSKRTSSGADAGEGELLAEAEAAGLALYGRTPIRGFPVSGAFLTLVGSQSAVSCDRMSTR